MKDDFTKLWQFLERCGPQASRRGLVASDREWIELIDRFIAGRCAAGERRQLAQFLQSHPEMIQQIAERVEQSGQHPEKPATDSAHRIPNPEPPGKAT